MKKFAIALVAVLTACAPSFEERIGEAVQANLENAESYKFTSLEEVKRITFGEELDMRIKRFDQHSKINKAMGFDRKDSVMLERLTELRTKKADSLDVLAATLYKHNFSCKNQNGDVVDTVFWIWVEDSVGEVLQATPYDVTNDASPREFSEYRTIFNEVLMK